MAEPARLTSFSPIFPVADLRRALAHYTALGFDTHAYAGGERYGYADRDGLSLHLQVRAGDLGEGHETYLHVDDADALYAEWSRRGIGGITRHVHDTPYEMREGAHIDLDGNVIRFGSPMSRSQNERLRVHLESRYSIDVTQVSELDLGVFEVNRRDGPSWVARAFPPTRPTVAVAGDAEVLRFLAEQEFPAERLATADPISDLDGQDVLVTEYVDGVGRAERKAAIQGAGGLLRLGELLGELHTLPGDGGAPTRSGGAWHHLADGGPRDEITAARALLADAAGLVAAEEGDLYEALDGELDALDDGAGLPLALVHPDFVLANVVATADRGMVLVDWAGAGRGPRLWSLAWLLFSEAAKDHRRIDLVISGYRRHVELDEDELIRLDAVARARWVVLKTWEFCMGRRGLADTALEIENAREIAESVGLASSRGVRFDEAGLTATPTARALREPRRLPEREGALRRQSR